MEKQLKPIKNEMDNANVNTFKKWIFLSKLGNIAKKTLDEIKELDKRIDYTKLVCVHTNGKIFHLEAFILVIYHWNK